MLQPTGPTSQGTFWALLLERSTQMGCGAGRPVCPSEAPFPSPPPPHLIRSSVWVETMEEHEFHLPHLQSGSIHPPSWEHRSGAPVPAPELPQGPPLSCHSRSPIPALSHYALSSSFINSRLPQSPRTLSAGPLLPNT